MSAQLQPFFCADCDAELKGRGVQMRDGRVISRQLRSKGRKADTQRTKDRKAMARAAIANPPNNRPLFTPGFMARVIPILGEDFVRRINVEDRARVLKLSRQEFAIYETVARDEKRPHEDRAAAAKILGALGQIIAQLDPRANPLHPLEVISHLAMGLTGIHTALALKDRAAEKWARNPRTVSTGVRLIEADENKQGLPSYFVQSADGKRGAIFSMNAQRNFRLIDNSLTRDEANEAHAIVDTRWEQDQRHPHWQAIEEARAGMQRHADTPAARAWVETEKKQPRPKRNQSMFGPDAIAKAKQVTKTPPQVIEKGTGERGEIIAKLANGFVKVAWRNRTKPTLIKRSELMLAKELNPARVPKKLRAAFSAKVKELVSEGYPQVQAVAVAFSEWRAGKLKAKNPHKSFHRLSTDRIRKETEILKKANALYKQAQAAADQGNDKLANRLGHKARALLARTRGRATEGPVGTLPNPDNWERNVSTIAKAIRRVISGAKRDRSVAMGKANIRQVLWSMGGLKSSDLSIAPSAFDRAFDEALKRVEPKGFKILNPMNKANGSVYSKAVSLGFPYLRGEGKAARNGTTWLSRFTKTADGKGAALYIGWNMQLGKWIVQKEKTRKNPQKTKRANPKAVDQFSQMFHGTVTGAKREVAVSSRVRNKNLARLGALPYLKMVNRPRGHGDPKHACGQCAIVLNPAQSFLCATPQHKLVLAGSDLLRAGKQLRAQFAEANPGKRGDVNLGKVEVLFYDTPEKHVSNGARILYYHPTAEETRRNSDRPALCIDPAGMLYLKGGRYRIDQRGIIN